MLKMQRGRQTINFSSGRIAGFATAVFIALGFIIPTLANSASREDIVKTALALEHTPYRYGGTSPTTGFDCSGFVYYVFSQCGMTVPRTASGQYNSSETVSESELQPGDLVFFKIDSSTVNHVGIYLRDRNFIQAGTTAGVVIESLDERYWKGYFAGAGTFF